MELPLQLAQVHLHHAVHILKCERYFCRTLYIGCLNIHGTHVTVNNNAMFFFVSDLKIVYYNNY